MGSNECHESPPPEPEDGVCQLEDGTDFHLEDGTTPLKEEADDED